MKINIKGIDKLKLFVKLYNHVQTTSFGNVDAKFKTDEEARQLLAKNNFDYARFNIFCDLTKDEVESTTYNAIYGNGQAIFEEIVANLKKELGLPADPTSTELKDKAEAGAKLGSFNPPPLMPPSLPSPFPAAAMLAPFDAGSPALGAAGYPALAGSPALSTGYPGLSLGDLGAGMGLGASVGAGPGVGAGAGAGFQIQNWDRFGKLKNDETLYFKQQANSGTSYWNPTPGSCGFISLGTTRDAVLKMLSETNNPTVQRLIVDQMELELLNSNLNTQFTFSSDPILTDRLKTLQRLASRDQEEVVAIQARLKEKYWTHTAFTRNPGILDHKKWYVSPTEFLEAMQKLCVKQNTGLKEFEVLTDVLRLSDAIENAKKSTKALDEVLYNPKLIKDYLQKCIPVEWMGANIALAWAITTKKTLRIWKHKDVLFKSDEVYLFRDTTDDILQQDPRFKDPSPIDIVHTPMLMGGYENHYERLIKVDVPVHGLRPSAAPLVFSSGLSLSNTPGFSERYAQALAFSGAFSGVGRRLDSY